MKYQTSKTAAGGGRRGSTLECASSLPLSKCNKLSITQQSAKGLAQPKTWCRFVAAFVFAALPMALNAQSYSIDWYKIAGGGGTSTGGVYSVSGTIGQPDAGGPMVGGNYSLTGGFWSLYAVQTPGAPVLSITLTTNTAMVYWNSPSTGYNLQVNSNLVTTNWVTPAEGVTDNGTIKYIIVNLLTGNRFYRLIFSP